MNCPTILLSSLTYTTEYNPSDYSKQKQYDRLHQTARAYDYIISISLYHAKKKTGELP
jgi:hypothetical protein